MAVVHYPKKRKILLAEDNEVNIFLFTEYLEIGEYQVLVARNGAEAVSLTQSERPELVIMDIRMPVMNGLEAAKRIRSMEEFENLPLVALTASIDPDEADACQKAGFNAFLNKPIGPKELLAALVRFWNEPEAKA